MVGCREDNKFIVDYANCHLSEDDEIDEQNGFKGKLSGGYEFLIRFSVGSLGVYRCLGHWRIGHFNYLVAADDKQADVRRCFVSAGTNFNSHFSCSNFVFL